jgi:hypothetical protein
MPIRSSTSWEWEKAGQRHGTGKEPTESFIYITIDTPGQTLVTA